MPLQKIRNFFELEAAAGITLGISALIAIIIANSPLSGAFDNWLHYEIPVQIGTWSHTADVKHWVKDGLMAIFFFHVGLEIKKEIMEGELSDAKKLALPVFGALGGMIMPALIFIAVIMLEGHQDLIKGWTIPVATDIAFAVAAIAVVAKNIPSSLKIFLLTLAVVDDLGAVVLIAALYSSNIDYVALSWSLGIFVVLLALPRLGIRRPWVFVMGGLLMWAFMLQSGFHPTLAGVMTAITVPLKSNSDAFESPLEDLHDDFSAWVKYAIMPLFALTHAGFSFSGMGISTILSPLVVAIVCGLSIGKPLGVLGMVYFSKIIGIARIPENITMRQLLGVGALCGIGFTMSLFLGGLSYADKGEIISNELKMGVFLGSIISGIMGIALLAKSNEKA